MLRWFVIASFASCARQVDRSDEEARVYGAVVDSLGQSSILVSDWAYTGSIVAEGPLPTGFDEEAWQDFQQAIHDHAPPPEPTEHDTMVEFGEPGDRFPYVAFSHVGFDARYQHAVVVRGMYDEFYGEWWLCGLKWGGGRWRVTQEVLSGYAEGWD